jgi:cyanophycinase
MKFKHFSLVVSMAILGFACEQQDAVQPESNFKKSSNDLKATTMAVGYTNWVVGDPADVVRTPLGGTVLAGGGADVDAAMKWMLQNASGGDVIVLRNAQENEAPWAGADAYNSYFYSELGVTVNSVETILLNSRTVATNAEVIQKVRNAECLFMTGGDQATYYKFIEGTGLEDAINYIKNTRKSPVGGTSAGCAVQGNYIFSAENGTITSAEALANPFNTKLVLRNNLFSSPFLANTITDTHFDNPDRRGRLLTFMARMNKSFAVSVPRSIGVDEGTAVCIDKNGRARVYGAGTAFFIQQNGSSNTPERCVSGSSLDWYRSTRATKVYKANGTTTGTNYFELSSWTTGSGGSWQYYYVDRGTLKVSY